jgi:O-succinylhomoserine sulfhydrylase
MPKSWPGCWNVIARRQMKKGGGLVAFEIVGGVEAGRKFLDNLTMCSLSANLGDTRTIVTHPASTTHARISTEARASAGITNGMIRISAGLEHVDDIWEDLRKALTST